MLPAAAQTIKDGGELRAALTGEPDMLDPAVSSIYTGAQVYEGIFSKLIDVAPDNSFVPDLATEWTQTDATTWTGCDVRSSWPMAGTLLTLTRFSR